MKWPKWFKIPCVGWHTTRLDMPLYCTICGILRKKVEDRTKCKKCGCLVYPREKYCEYCGTKKT